MEGKEQKEGDWNRVFPSLQTLNLLDAAGILSVRTAISPLLPLRKADNSPLAVAGLIHIVSTFLMLRADHQFPIHVHSVPRSHPRTRLYVFL